MVLFAQQVRHSIERELVAVETHAGDGAGGHRADYGTLAELVAGGRVGNMDFHKRQVLVNDHVRGVGESIRIVREGGGVHDHRGFLVGGLVHPVHHFGFVVGLAHLDFEAEVLAPFGAELAQGVEVLTTVESGWRTPRRPRLGPLTTMTLVIGTPFVCASLPPPLRGTSLIRGR